MKKGRGHRRRAEALFPCPGPVTQRTRVGALRLRRSGPTGCAFRVTTTPVPAAYLGSRKTELLVADPDFVAFDGPPGFFSMSAIARARTQKGRPKAPMPHLRPARISSGRRIR